jgi:hypothetical protein
MKVMGELDMKIAKINIRISLDDFRSNSIVYLLSSQWQSCRHVLCDLNIDFHL